MTALVAQSGGPVRKWERACVGGEGGRADVIAISGKNSRNFHTYDLKFDKVKLISYHKFFFIPFEKKSYSHIFFSYLHFNFLIRVQLFSYSKYFFIPN
jgi:hypothetical protein